VLLWALALAGVQGLIASHGTPDLGAVESRVHSLPAPVALDLASAGLPILEEDAGDSLGEEDLQLPAAPPLFSPSLTSQLPVAFTAALTPETLPWRARVLGAQGPPAHSA
jgi:hypothetical protein